MRNKILTPLCSLVILLLMLSVSACGTPGDPMQDDMYTRNIYLGDYTLERELSDGSGGYWHEYNLSAFSSSPGASGATLIPSNVSTLGGYRLDDITETLYFTTHVEYDWDEISDAIVEVTFEVNVDNTGGNVGDTVEIGVECYHKIVGELGNTVNSHEGSVIVGQSQQHELFVMSVPIDDIRFSETIAVGLNLNTVSSEVDNIIVNYIEFKYKTKTPSMESS